MNWSLFPKTYALTLLLTVSHQGYGVDFNTGDDLLKLHAHATGVAGATTGDAENLALHGHDPNQEATIQALELGISFFPTDFIEGFASVNTFLNLEDELESEWEESFLKWKKIPGGFELRGGAYLNRLGLQNNTHLHGWDFVDSNLSTNQFLGEDSLFTEGGELSWFGNYKDSLLGVSSSFGRARQHSHDEEGGDDDDDEHGHSESFENAFFGNELWSTSGFVRYSYNDFHQHQFGVNLAIGENGFDRRSELYGFDYQYNWRENGLKPGGKAIKAQLEYMMRKVEWQSEDRDGDSSQSSLMASLAYTFMDDWTVATRYGWVEGVKDSPELHMGEIEYGFEVEEIRRASVAVTRKFTLSSLWSGYIRLQYNNDDREAFDGTDHSVWLQVNLDYGHGEVR